MTDDDKLRARKHRLIVRVLPSDDKIGSIYIPEKAKGKSLRGKVIAVGRGYLQDDGSIIPLDVKVGDVVCYGDWIGDEFELDGQPHMMLHECHVLGFVEHG